MFKNRNYYNWPHNTTPGVIVAWLVVLIPVVVGIIALRGSLGDAAHISRVVSDPYEKALQAPTAKSMADQLDQVLINLKEQGMDKGHTYGPYHSVLTDQARAISDITAYRDRVRALETTSPESANFATNMSDIRMSLTAIGLPWAPAAFWDARSTWLFFAMFPGTILVAIFAYQIVDPTVNYWQQRLQGSGNRNGQRI